MAYTTYVRPIVEYATCLWSPDLIKNIKAIENVQRHFTKRIPALKNFSYAERLAALRLESLQYRRLKFDLIMYYKVLNNLTPWDPSDFFTEYVNPHNTRSRCKKLFLPLIQNNLCGNDFLLDA